MPRIVRLARSSFKPMNLLLIYPHEIENGCARINGDRARWVLETFRPKIGDKLVCGVLNGQIGEALISYTAAEEIVAHVSLTRDPHPRLPAEIIVGLSRPQTMKKVLHFAASVGIETVRLVRCEGSEKSYLDSHLLRDDDMAAELDLGLCQGVETVRPNVIIHQTFAGCVQGFLSGSLATAAVKWVGDTSPAAGDVSPILRSLGEADSTEPSPFPHVPPPFAIAVGPEKGFSGQELATLVDCGGFKRITLGARQLRVEFALAALVGRCL